MFVVTVGTYDMEPSSYSVLKADLDSPDSERSEDGYLHRDRVRSGLYTISLTFNNITGQKVSDIEAAIEPAEFEVTFPDTTGNLTKTMYAGNKTRNFTRNFGGARNEDRWTLSFDLIEY